MLSEIKLVHAIFKMKGKEKDEAQFQNFIAMIMKTLTCITTCCISLLLHISSVAYPMDRDDRTELL